MGRESATGPRLNSARASGCTPPCSVIRVALSGIRVTRFGIGGVCWLRAWLAASKDTSAKAHPNGSFRKRFFIFGYPNCPDSADAASAASGKPRHPTSFLPSRVCSRDRDSAESARRPGDGIDSERREISTTIGLSQQNVVRKATNESLRYRPRAPGRFWASRFPETGTGRHQV
jgi:hypothetical protein